MALLSSILLIALFFQSRRGKISEEPLPIQIQIQMQIRFNLTILPLIQSLKNLTYFK
jgi:hypothetical protein